MAPGDELDDDVARREMEDVERAFGALGITPFEVPPGFFTTPPSPEEERLLAKVRGSVDALTLMTRLPPHACGLSLTHNAHKDVSLPLREWLEELCRGHEGMTPEGDFASLAKMDEAIAKEECWVLQWSPHTPIEFRRVMAPTLDEVLAMAHDIALSIAFPRKEHDDGPREP
jgi:hypothetical protein